MKSQGVVRSGVYGIVLWKIDNGGHERIVNVLDPEEEGEEYLDVPEGRFDDCVVMAEHHISRGSYGPQQIGERTDWELALALMPELPTPAAMNERLRFKPPHDNGLKIFEKYRSHWVQQGNERDKFQREVGLELQRGWLAGMRSAERTFGTVIAPLLEDREQVIAFSKTALAQSKIGAIEAILSPIENSTSNHLAVVIMMLVQMYEVSTVEDLLVELWEESVTISSLDFVELLALRRENASVIDTPLAWQIALAGA